MKYTEGSYSFLEAFLEESKSRVLCILCGDVNRDFCDRVAAVARDKGVSVQVFEVVKAEHRQRVVSMVASASRSPLLAGLLAALFVVKPLFQLTLRFIQARVGEEVLNWLKDSDSVVWVGLHEDFDVYFLVDRRVHKALRGKNILLLAYPSRVTAERLGISFEDYWKNYLNALNAPWEELKNIGGRLRKQLENAAVLRIRTQLGTDFEARYQPSQLELFYGVVNEKALKEGRLILLLPGGELSISSVKKPLSIRGKMFFDIPVILDDKVVSGVEVVVEDGRVVDYAAERNKEALEDFFKHKGSRRVHELGFGLNPAIRPCGSMYLDEKAYRTVHAGFGIPHTPLHRDFVMSNPIVHVNGRELSWLLEQTEKSQPDPRCRRAQR